MNHLTALATKLKYYPTQAIVPLYSTWRHYKGEQYFVIGFVVMENNAELGVCLLHKFDEIDAVPLDAPFF